MAGTAGEFDTSYKLGRVLSRYGLSTLHERLPELWQGTGGDGLSLRALADEINTRILQRRLEEAGEDPLEGDAATAYEHLTGDVSAGVRTQQRRRLERLGIDVDTLESEFVSHQAVHTYLTEGLGLSTSSPDEGDRVERTERRLNKLRGRTAAVAESSLADLAAADALTVGDLECSVDLRVFCTDCNRGYELTALLDRGGCACADADGES